MPLSFCCLVHDDDTVSEIIPSSEMLVVNNEFERVWEEAIFPNVSYVIKFSLTGWAKVRKLRIFFAPAKIRITYPQNKIHKRYCFRQLAQLIMVLLTVVIMLIVMKIMTNDNDDDDNSDDD